MQFFCCPITLLLSCFVPNTTFLVFIISPSILPLLYFKNLLPKHLPLNYSNHNINLQNLISANSNCVYFYDKFCFFSYFSVLLLIPNRPPFTMFTKIRMTVTLKQKILIQDDWSNFTFLLNNEILCLNWQLISNYEKEIAVRQPEKTFKMWGSWSYTQLYNVSPNPPRISALALHHLLLFVHVLEDSKGFVSFIQ